MRRVTRLSPAALLILLLAPAACIDSVGLQCPKEEPGCDDDLKADSPDAAALPDLTPSNVDLLTCLTTCTGCCDGEGHCQTPTTVLNCGPTGKMCKTCDPTRADNCKTGFCGCGLKPACGDGLRCTDQGCVCDATSCPGGCCDGNFGCHPFGLDTCSGEPGAQCGRCDMITADGCKAGCTCGGHAPCAQGQHCVNGGCVCDAVSCQGGCCSSSQQCMPRTLSSCVASSTVMACVPCSQLLTDTCTVNGCVCGLTGAACLNGQKCSQGKCVCDPQTCTGCCSQGIFCKGGFNTAACGKGGATCAVCDVASGQTCPAGVCIGGMTSSDGGGMGSTDGGTVNTDGSTTTTPDLSKIDM